MRDQIMPPLKWAGGKRWLVPTLREIYCSVESSRLVEPFVGGMAITLGLRPEAALLNDTNPHIINFFTELKRGFRFSLPYGNKKEDYYQARDDFNALVVNNDILGNAAAQLFYYLIRTGYNGLCRFNKSGLFNVPFGRFKKIDYHKDLLAYSSYLKDWQFTHGDFASIEVNDNDFIYMDPPYDVPFTQYHTLGYSWQDQLRLVRWAKDRSNPMIISNQATDRILSAYTDAGFDIFKLQAPRMIACNGNRTKAIEVLALKNFDKRVLKKVATSLQA
ncbi:MAG: Dam family site-specific DNA-(adenine-N6)-methyltransferase [Pseudomonadota bacterium]